MKRFSEANQKEYNLAEEHIDTLYDQKVSGRTILNLTKKELLSHPVEFPLGTAKAIIELIDILKPQHTFPLPTIVNEFRFLTTHIA